eukprot:6001652-Pyramimonas_sp.AAC.1
MHRKCCALYLYHLDKGEKPPAGTMSQGGGQSGRVGSGGPPLSPQPGGTINARPARTINARPGGTLYSALF